MSPITALAGGGGGTDDGRPLTWVGQVSARVDYETVSFNSGQLTATIDGKACMLTKMDWEPRWLIIDQLNIECSYPVWDNGIDGYDAEGRFCRWVNGSTTILCRKTIKNPVRPAFSDSQIAIGGENILIVMNRTGKPCEETLNLGKLNLTSVTIADEIGGIYFTATENDGKSMLYLAHKTKAGYRFMPMEMKAEQVCFGAQRLYLVDKWGVTSWFIGSNGKLCRDAIIDTASPHVLCGGDGDQVVFLTGYGGINSVGNPPDGKGISPSQ